MKTFKTISILISILLLSLKLFSQKQEFNCDLDEYQGRHGDNQQWNALIDNACKEIKKHNYQKGLDLLTEANNMEQDAYINGQLAGLKKFIAENKNTIGSNESSSPEKVENSNQSMENNEEKKPEPINKDEQNAPVQNNTGNPEVKTPDNKVEPTRADNQDISTQNTNPPESGNKNAELKTESENAEVLNKPAVTIPEQKTPDPIPAPVSAEPDQVKPIESSEKTFSDEEMAEFDNKGFQKLRLLENYIRDVSSKNTPADLAEKSLENAIQLFDNEDRTVQVSSINNEVKNSFRIRKYLERLQMMTYDRVEIEWAQFDYVSKFTKGYDGNYHGYVTFRQKFTGIKDYIPVYSDVTTKKIEVIIKPYEKGILGQQWDVFLGDMSVIHTEKN